MSKRIFIWVGHPKPGSLCEGMADAYQEGAEKAGAEVRRMNLADMSFDMNIAGFGDRALLENDLAIWQENITWADHLFFLHPYWWGAMPTKAKSVLDRALAPGFGFKYRGKGMAWDKLLSGKTADALITSDTPPLIDTFIYRKPARRVMKNQVFAFCGIKTRKIVQFGSVKSASHKKIIGWIDEAKSMGATAVH